jgi:hypothetical protein
MYIGISFCLKKDRMANPPVSESRATFASSAMTIAFNNNPLVTLGRIVIENER